MGPGGSALWHRGSRARGCWSAPRGLVCTGAGLSSRSRSPTSARKAPSGLTRLDHREGLAYSMVLGSEKGEMRTLFCAVQTSRPHVSRCTPQLTHNTHIRKDAAVTSENNLTPELAAFTSGHEIRRIVPSERSPSSECWRFPFPRLGERVTCSGAQTSNFKTGPKPRGRGGGGHGRTRGLGGKREGEIRYQGDRGQ